MKWLIYSELERSRKSGVLSVIIAVIAVGIFVLIALSFNYGNLGKLPIEAKESFFDMNNSVSVPLIAIISGFIIDAAIDRSREDNLCYRLFRRSTPISPLFIIFLITQGTAFEISQEDITGFFLKLFPFSPLIILGLLAACLLLTAAGIKRREK